jgi:type II secretory ATPase GspE/PulE/Tfp pilus assembly ATPase PilB-like protein
MIHARKSVSELKQKAIELGMKTLADDGREKIALGLTTEAEVASEVVA